MAYDYIRRTYGVDPVPGERVRHQVTNREGTIAAIRGDDHCVHVRFDGDKRKKRCHPDAVDYLGAAGVGRGDLAVSYQRRVLSWVLTCFGLSISYDQKERSHRFLEEAIELAQAIDCTRDEAHQLVDYVFDRPAGAATQEVGGVMVTLAALSTSADIDMLAAGEAELGRVLSPEVMERVRAKNTAKLRSSPLPGQIGPTFAAAGGGL